MKILLFSDTHLHKELEEKKLQFLKKIISSADKVIILGDFWERGLMTFDEFIHSPWSELFPLLKEKKTIYLYGNHDPKEVSDSRVSLFSDVQAQQYTFNAGGKQFIVEHGDRFFSKNIIYTVAISRVFKKFVYGKLFTKWYHTNWESFMINRFGKNALTKIYFWNNKDVKKTMLKEFKKGTILICGHTHVAEIDLENNFVNTGIIRHGLGQYVIIDDKKITIHEEWYDKPFKTAILK